MIQKTVEQDSQSIAENIAMLHNKLSHGERSRLEHYIRCHSKGSVPETHYTGGWFNNYSPSAMIALFLRLPKKLQKLVTKPAGLSLGGKDA